MGEEWPIAELFNEDYLHFYLPTLTDEVTDAQSAVVWDLASIREGADVLDLACGHGRIANRMAQRGARVTGLDATPLFLELAREDARQRGVAVEYIHGDMRALPWSEKFDVVVSWFTAYGYFDDEQNHAVLTEVYRSLRPSGRFLIELNHKDALLPTWLPASVVRTEDGIMIDERVYDPVTGRADTIRTIIRNGRIRRSTFFTRLFSFTELRGWLLQAGFGTVSGFGSDGSPLTAESRRLIVVAQK